jgi:hypothetical protein
MVTDESDSWAYRAAMYAAEALVTMSRGGLLIFELFRPSQLGDSSLPRYYTDELSIYKYSYEYVYGIAKSVNDDLRSLGVISRSMDEVLPVLKRYSKDFGAALIPKQRLVAVNDKLGFITVNRDEVIFSLDSIRNWLGPEYATRISKLQNPIDELILFAFVNYEIVDIQNSPDKERVNREITVSHGRNISQLLSKGSDVHQNFIGVRNKVNIDPKSAALPFNTWDKWKIDYNALNVFVKSNQTKVADAKTLNDMARVLSPIVGAPVASIELLLGIECGYPNRATYRSTMPRDDGSRTYIGITQVSTPFWTDVQRQVRDKGLGAWPSRFDATLEQQMAAPFIYADKYRDTRNADTNDISLRDFPLSPALLYAFHQQSFGGLRSKFTKLKGVQSGVSVEVVKSAARSYTRGKVFI